jgi:hypothetical protein
MQRVHVSKKDKQQKKGAKSKQSNNTQQKVVDSLLIQRATHAPKSLTPVDVQALQDRYGNQYVQRLLDTKDSVQRDETDGELPDISGLSETAQALLEGVLEKNTINAAVRQLHANTFTKTGWKYTATTGNVSGQSYVNGGQKAGMCESYRNAFGYILSVYDNLRATHPVAAIRTGDLDIENGDDLSDKRFYTKTGLTLMGATKLKGNVYLEADGDGTLISADRNTINRFVFKGHWTLKVNGVEYDPIFPGSIDQDNVQAELDEKYSNGTMRLFPDTRYPIDTGEFGATFVLVKDYNKFVAAVNTLTAFYNTNKVDIDWMGSSKFYQRWKKGIFKKGSSDIVKQAKTVVQGNVSNVETFMQLVTLGYDYNVQAVSREQKKAIEALLKLAGH